MVYNRTIVCKIFQEANSDLSIVFTHKNEDWAPFVGCDFKTVLLICSARY